MAQLWGWFAEGDWQITRGLAGFLKNRAILAQFSDLAPVG